MVDSYHTLEILNHNYNKMFVARRGFYTFEEKFLGSHGLNHLNLN